MIQMGEALVQVSSIICLLYDDDIWPHCLQAVNTFAVEDSMSCSGYLHSGFCFPQYTGGSSLYEVFPVFRGLLLLCMSSSLFVAAFDLFFFAVAIV